MATTKRGASDVPTTAKSATAVAASMSATATVATRPGEDDTGSASQKG